MIQFGRSVVEPAFVYWRKKMDGQLLRVRQVFESCRLCNPRRINDIAPGTVRELLQRFKFLHGPFATDPLRVDRLLAELPLYRARAAGLTDLSREINKWWVDSRSTLPEWSSLATTVALLQPSSATAERCFSILKGLFKDNQSCCPIASKTAACVPIMKRKDPMM